MGAGSEWIEASSCDCFGSRETHTKNLSGRQKENRGCRTSTLGEVQGREKEIDGICSSGACCEYAAGFRALMSVNAG
jgi:hypothetical protein